jgi:hypothetical protein
MAPVKRSGDQALGVVVVDVGVGNSDLHAAYAVLYFGFDVTEELGVDAPPVEDEVFFAIVTP